MTLALEVCRAAERHVGRDGLRRVRTVAVQVGDQAGVEVGSLEFCLQALLSHPPFEEARPVILRSGGDELRIQYLEVDDDDPDDRGS